MKRLLLPALIGLALAGCGTAPPVPRDHYYRLLVPGPETSRTEVPFPGVMQVEPLQADGLLSERPLLYSQSGASHELQQHNYHYWTDSPARLLQDQMVAWLRRGHVADTVVTPEMRIRADYQVGGKLKRLERLLGGGAPRVHVELELSLIRLADDHLVLVENFSGQEPVADGSVDAAVLAINRITARLFDRFTNRALAAAPNAPGIPQAARKN